MSPELLIALFGFAAASTFTPGPNNVMLMASGAKFGLRRTLPHASGIFVGMSSLVLLSGAGLAALIAVLPAAQLALKLLATGYLLWLAWRLVRTDRPASGSAGHQPLTVLQAALFQWVNPKAWAMVLTGLSAFAPEADWPSVMLVALVFGLVLIPSATSWTLAGSQLSRWLTNPARRIGFNLIMAGLLLLSIIPMVR